MWKDSETELDFLDFDYLINLLQDLIADETLLPSSIGVYGDWGSGKSSLICMSMNKAASKKGTVCLVFNGWLFEGYEDAKTALMGSILDAIQENTSLTQKAKDCLGVLYRSVDKMKLLKNGIQYATDIAVTGGLTSVVSNITKGILSKLSTPINLAEVEHQPLLEEIQNELDNKSVREDIKEFQNKFSELLEESKIDRLVIFIDELDRCSPDTILETLEAIRLFLFTGKSVFIIGADERHISYAVQRKFDEIEGQQMNIGKEYLEKIIQYPIRIPRLSVKEMEFYITCLLIEKDLSAEEFGIITDFFKTKKAEDFMGFTLSHGMIYESLPEIAEKIKESLIIARQLSDVLAQGLNGNPRHCKRFLNSLVMREKMAEYKGLSLDRKILAKIMLVEYFKPSLFKQIADNQAIEHGFSTELQKLEDDEMNDDSLFKNWKDDLWVQKWRLLGPKLNEIDLRTYFYFSRESLVDKNINIGNKISPLAKQVLEKLLSKGRSARSEALKVAGEINDFEACEVSQKLFSTIITASSIDKDLMSSYLDWGETKLVLHSEVLSDLNSIPGNKVKLGVIPLIKDYAIKTKQTEQVKELFTKWSKENSKIKGVLLTNIGEM